MNRDYCACIRTLGKAGEKYQTLLDSLKRQTIQPKKILVYIPYGYDLPKETIGIEQYIRCEKGMVHQRSLSFDEVDTKWILLLDDDLFIPDDGIEKLFRGLEEKSGDFISPDVFKVQDLNIKSKFTASLFSFTLPRPNDKWAFKIRKNGSYTYNNKPSEAVLLTQSAAGPCMLLKKYVYNSVHLDDERYMDSFKYVICDDFVESYKIYKYGYKLLIHYNSGIEHLDARSGRVSDPKERYLLSSVLWFVMWYRVFYNLKHNTKFDKMRAMLSFLIREIWWFVFNAIPRSIKYRNIDSIKIFFRKYGIGMNFLKSEYFKKIPLYDEYI